MPQGDVLNDEVFSPDHRLPNNPVIPDTQTFEIQEGRRGLNGVNVNLISCVQDAVDLLSWLGERRPVLAIDTETTGFNAWGGKLRTVQIGDAMTGWTIPWEQWGGVFLEAMDRYDGPITGHNWAFDARWLTVHTPWKIPWHRCHDTMIMAHVIDPTQAVGLKPLSDRFVDRRASAGEHLLKQAFHENKWSWDTVPIDFGPYWEYAALDTVLTARLWEGFRADLKYPGVYDLEMQTRRICSRMEDRGAPIDLDYCVKSYDVLSEYVDRTKKWFMDEHKVKAGSAMDLVRWFTANGGVIERTTASGKPAMDKYQLRLLAQQDFPYAGMAKVILDMRRADKMAGTYFKNFIEKNVDGELHCSIRTLGARTSRMSITDPALQTLPKGDPLVRNAFIPSEGNALLSVDYSQIEMRLFAHFSGSQQMAAAFSGDEDFFVTLCRQIYNDPTITKDDKRRGLTKNCVPINSEILTQRGWLRHDEVCVGDETLGYDFETKTSRWTPITGVHLSPDAEVFRFGHKQREFFCTYDHRWVAEEGRGTSPRRFVHAYEQPGTETRIVLAVPAEDGASGITPHEAAVLGWALGDGSIKRIPVTGRTAQGRDGHRAGCYMSICQTKPDEIAKIDKLLHDVPHIRDERRGQTFWAIKSSWSRPLLDKAGIQGKLNFDPWKLAASLSNEARRAMARALDDADGKNKKFDSFAVVQSASSPVAELCVALGYLTGCYARNTTYEADGVGWQRNPIKVIWHQHPYFTGQRATLTSVGRQDTWCVSTELGSWTMRQPHDNVPVLTGNTMYGKAYGAGISKMAETAGVTFDQMKQVVDTFDEKYPDVKRFQKEIENVAGHREMTEGVAYVMTPFGRRLPADSGRGYALLNYLLQSHAAELLKRALVRLDAAGLGEYLVLPIHDEVIADVPKGDAEDAKKLIVECMEVADGTYLVPLEAEGEGPFARWGDKYAKPGAPPMAITS